MKLKKLFPLLLLALLLAACAPKEIEDDDFTMPPTKPLAGSPTDPSEPQPTDPALTEPQPTEPEPTEPEPTDPEPTEPEEFDPDEQVHVHRFGTWKVSQKATCVKEGYKVRSCGCGEMEYKSYLDDHKYGEWTVKTEPTCTQQGMNARFCKICKAEENTITAELGHDEVITPGTPATCTTPGVEDLIQCGRCDEILKESSVIEPAHQVVEQKYVAPACGLPGQTEGSYCSACLEVFQKGEVIAAIEHDPVTVPGKAATCTDIGLTDSVACSKCNAVLSRPKVINRLAHDMENGVCTRCGHNCDHGVDPAKPDEAGKHEAYVDRYEGTSCLDLGYAIYACEECEQESQYYVSYIHGVACDSTEFRTVVDPTPYRTGMIESHCGSCGDETHYIIEAIIAQPDERLEFSQLGGVQYQYGEDYWEYFVVLDERPAGSTPLSFRVLSDTELEVSWLDEEGKECSVVLSPSTDSQRPSTKCVISTDGNYYVSNFGWVAVG